MKPFLEEMRQSASERRAAELEAAMTEAINRWAVALAQVDELRSRILALERAARHLVALVYGDEVPPECDLLPDPVAK